MQAHNEFIIPNNVRMQLQRLEHDHMPVVLMTCGIAGKQPAVSYFQAPYQIHIIYPNTDTSGACNKGAGKTTLTKAVLAEFPSFRRISIDEIIYSRHGLYNIDYPADKYAEFSVEARDICLREVEQLLRDQKKDIVLDRSFWAKGDRDFYSDLIRRAGARPVLVYLKAPRDVLWKRICERRAKGVDADCALEIGEELLDRYCEVFEAPVGEGEIVIETN